MPSVIRHAAAAPTALHSQVPTGNRGQAGEGGKWIPNCSFTTIITVFAPLSPSATRAIGVREVGDRADSLIVWALLALLWINLAAIIRMETFIPIRAANPRRRAQTSHCIEFDCHFEFQMALEPASLSHVPWKVSQRVQPRPFLMTEMPECSVSLTTGRKEGGAGWQGGRGKIIRATPLRMAPQLRNSTGTLSSKWSQLRWPYATVWPASASKTGCVQTACGLPCCSRGKYYVQHISRCTPGRTECIGRDGRYIQDTCGIFVPCHYRALPGLKARE